MERSSKRANRTTSTTRPRRRADERQTATLGGAVMKGRLLTSALRVASRMADATLRVMARGPDLTLGLVGRHRPHEDVRRVPAKQPGRGGSLLGHDDDRVVRFPHSHEGEAYLAVRLRLEGEAVMRRTGRIRFCPRGRLGARERDDLQGLREVTSARTCRSCQVLVPELGSWCVGGRSSGASCGCPPDRRPQSPRRRCCSPTRPGTVFRARLPPRQCLSASEKDSSAAGQGFLLPAAFLRVTEPGMYPECQVKRALRRPVTRPWCGAGARSRRADRRARAAHPSATPRARVRSRGGGPPRSAARASTGVRRPGRWGRTGLSRYRPWCASVLTDCRG